MRRAGSAGDDLAIAQPMNRPTAARPVYWRQGAGSRERILAGVDRLPGQQALMLRRLGLLARLPIRDVRSSQG